MSICLSAFDLIKSIELRFSYSVHEFVESNKSQVELVAIKVATTDGVQAHYPCFRCKLVLN